METNGFRSDNYDLNQSLHTSRILLYLNFCSKILSSTVSNAFCNSTKIPQSKLPSTRVCLILSVRLIRAWLVECFCQKPNCKEYIRLLISKKLESLVYMSFSMIFSILEKWDIGL